MSVQKFKTYLRKIGSWTIAPAPFETFKVYGTRQTFRVKGTIDKEPFSGKSLMPFGDGTHFLTVAADIRKKIKKEAGDEVYIILEPDDNETDIPEELLEALEASDEARQYFDKTSSSEKRYLSLHILNSKIKETRVKRAVSIVLNMERAFLENRKFKWEKKSV